MTADEITYFEKLNSQLAGAYTEINALSKKSPNDSVNKFKLKFVNEILKKAAVLLGSANLPLEDFQGFDDDDLPSNSDVCFMITQYLECLEQQRAGNIHKQYSTWYWLVDGRYDESFPTAPPRKLTSK